MLLQKTRKLYYGKWAYKISLTIPEGCTILRRSNGELSFYRRGFRNDNDIDAFIEKMSLIPNKIFKTRKEYRSFTFFCDNQNDYESIKTHLSYWIYEAHEPENVETLDFLIKNGVKKIICKNYPHEKFRFKIKINKHMSSELRHKFLDWCLNFKDQINFPNFTKDWLKDHYGWSYSDPYFYVENEKLLTMIRLYLGTNCKKTEEFVLEKNINS